MIAESNTATTPNPIFADCMVTALLRVKAQLASDNPDVVLKAAKLIFELERSGMRHHCEITGASSLGVAPATPPQLSTPAAPLPPTGDVRTPEVIVNPPKPIVHEQRQPLGASVANKQTQQTPQSVPIRAATTPAASPQPIPPPKVTHGNGMRKLQKHLLTGCLRT